MPRRTRTRRSTTTSPSPLAWIAPNRLLVSYRYTENGQLHEVLDATGQRVRRFTYTPEGYLNSHQLASGAVRQYEWARFSIPEIRPTPKRADGTPYRMPPLLEPQYRYGERERVVFNYDPLGRRISKEVYQSDYPEPRRRVLFHWQGLRLLQEVQNGLASLYIYASSISYEPITRIDGKHGNEEFAHFHTNQAGLPTQLTNDSGDIVWWSNFRGWGASRDEWNTEKQAREQNLRYQGQYFDREIKLHYNTYRFYDPVIGSFTQTDPLGLLGGPNLYKYAPNPISWIDPLGLSCNRFGFSISNLIVRLRATLRIYPKVIDPRTGRSIPFPAQIGGKIPTAARVPWGASERGAFIKDWYDRGYATPRGGWREYDIHHIKPREYGGDNTFWNLVPVQRKTHQELFNTFWRNYNEF